MFIKKIFNYNTLFLLLSIIAGLSVGLIVTYFCVKYNLLIYGVNIDIFIAPVIAGFVETYLSNITRNKSSGAISAILLFIITNGLGWLFPAQPLTFNIFTVGGLILMLQAAFPLMVNYLLIVLLFVFMYLLGLLGSFIGVAWHNKENTPITVNDIENNTEFKIKIFNSKPDIPIEKYHGIVFAEDVIDFDDKNSKEKFHYMRSNIEIKNTIQKRDYDVARLYILHNLEKEALKLNANAIIDIELEYTNYNQQFPPDVVIAAYGTAVTIDKKYLK